MGLYLRRPFEPKRSGYPSTQQRRWSKDRRRCCLNDQDLSGLFRRLRLGTQGIHQAGFQLINIPMFQGFFKKKAISGHYPETENERKTPDFIKEIGRFMIFARLAGQNRAMGEGSWTHRPDLLCFCSKFQLSEEEAPKVGLSL